ncbi:MAG: hypothetical protein AB8G86_29570 [Saprospiraceae bacterium]
MKKDIYYHIISEISLIEKTDELIKKLEAAREGDLGIDFTPQYKRIIRKTTKKILLKMIELELSFEQFKDLYETIFKYLEKRKSVNRLPEDLEKEVNNLALFLK